jgi:hypothetical protein
MNQSDNKETENNSEFKNVPPVNKKGQLYSNHLENIIKSITNPSFLGSIHMKNTSFNKNSIENLVESDLNLKTTKALKSTLFNPVTKIFIILAIVFNLIWFLLVAIL